MKTTIGAMVCLCIFVGGFLVFPKEISDRLNPFVPEEEVYVQINEKGVPRSPGGYDYTLQGYTKKGEKKEVTFYAGKQLKADAFLKLSAKGTYVETWQEVYADQMPEEVKERLISSF